MVDLFCVAEKTKRDVSFRRPLLLPQKGCVSLNKIWDFPTNPKECRSSPCCREIWKQSIICDVPLLAVTPQSTSAGPVVILLAFNLISACVSPWLAVENLASREYWRQDNRSSILGRCGDFFFDSTMAISIPERITSTFFLFTINCTTCRKQNNNFLWFQPTAPIPQLPSGACRVF